MVDVKTVSILGATGSIGRNTVDVLMSMPEQPDVQAVTANTNAEELAEIALKLNAKAAVVADESAYARLKDALAGSGIQAAAGQQAVIEAASMPADWTMAAIVGMAGLMPVLQAVEQGRVVAIANKEPLVSAGPLVMNRARECGTTILPVDSEHNAIFQVFELQNRQAIERIILTGSGGPFRTWSREKMASATPEAAIAHPNWSMGAKISVDSATMMNKALEIIEAQILFDMPADRIDVLVHPQSVIHSMVEYQDGSVLAQLGAPDMRTPIAHALAWPQRMAGPAHKLDLTAMARLDFEAPDMNKFPALRLAYECLHAGLAHCIAFNAANEIAVGAFLNRRLAFGDIVTLIEDILAQIESATPKTLEEILLLDKTVRESAEFYISNNAVKNDLTG